MSRSTTAPGLKTKPLSYSFPCEQFSGYRKAAIGFKGSDKPDLPRRANYYSQEASPEKRV